MEYFIVSISSLGIGAEELQAAFEAVDVPSTGVCVLEESSFHVGAIDGGFHGGTEASPELAGEIVEEFVLGFGVEFFAYLAFAVFIGFGSEF